MNPTSKSSVQDKTVFSKILTDCENRIYTEEWKVSSKELEAGENWSVKKCRLAGGVSDGVDVLTVNNGKLSFDIVPTRGMGILKGQYEDVFLGWNAAIKNPIHPSYVNLEARGGLGWLSGFNEWIVRCGLASIGQPSKDTIIDNNGNEKEIVLTLHGRIANIPANFVQVNIGLEPPNIIEAKGVVYERSMFGPNLRLITSTITVPGSNWLTISDSIENLRSFPDEMQLLYHCNFGKPFLEKGASLLAPIRRVAPRDPVASKGIDLFDVFGAPESGFIEQVYYMELLSDANNYTKVMLQNRMGDKAVSIGFSVKELPCFTLWKNTAAEEDGYIMGLEPGTSFPNPKRFERERNRVLKLRPKNKYNARITLSFHIGKDKVQKASEEIRKIQGKTKPIVYKDPVKDFAPS
jgi:hypothetical protein